MSLKRQFTLLLFFGLVAGLALYHPLLHSGTHITGNTTTDYHLFYWAFWWGEHALTTPDLNVYLTDYVMYPFEHNLVYHTLALGWLPIWIPANALLGQFHAMNLLFMISLTLTGFSTFHLLRSEGISIGLALLGGIILEISLPMLRAIWWSQANLITLFWLPLQILAWRQVTLSQRPLFWAILQGVLLWWMILLDNQYPLLIAPILIPYGLMTLLKGRRFILYGGVVMAVALTLLWFAGPLPYLLEGVDGEFVRANIEDATRIKSLDTLLWNKDDYYTVIRVGGVIPALILLGLLGSNQYKRRWFWFALIPFPFLLILGPTTVVYRTMHETLGGIFRYPDRFITTFSLPALIFGGLSLTPNFKQLSPKARPMLVSLALLLIFINLRTLTPMPIQPIPTQYDFYQVMAEDSEDYVVIEVPNAAGTGVRWVGDIDAVALEYYGTQHHKKMLNALLSRTPTRYWWYMRSDDPLLSWLGQRRLLEPQNVEAELNRLIYEYPVGYIVIHPELIRGLPSTAEEIIGYLNALPQLLCPPIVEKGAIAYQALWLSDGCINHRQLPRLENGAFKLDLGAPGDELYLGQGWHYREQIGDLNLRWMGKNQQMETDLYLDLPVGRYEITLHGQAFWQAQRLEIRLNDVPITPEPILLETDLQTIQMATEIRDGQNLKLTLAYEATHIPSEVIPNNGDMRELALAIDWIQFDSID